MKHRRMRPSSGAMLVSPRWNEGDGIVDLVRAIALRLVDQIGWCDEKVSFLLAVLGDEECRELRRSLEARLDEHGIGLEGLSRSGIRDALESALSFLLGNAASGESTEGIAPRRLAALLDESFMDILATGQVDADGPLCPTGDLGKRVVELARLFDLGLEECSVLLFFFAMGQCGELERLACEFSVQQRARFLAVATGLGLDGIYRALGQKSGLVKGGLLERESGESLMEACLSPLLSDILAGVGGALSHERLCEESRVARYALADFHVEPLSIDIALAALRSGRPGNLLLYGPPGTGKTEFARSLAAAAGRRAWFLGASESPGARERRSALVLASASLDPAEDFLVVDEADSLLAVERRGLAWDSGVSKSWLNGFLDEPRRFLAWIVNDAGGLDDSVKRRFDFSIAFEKFGSGERRRIWEASASERGLHLDKPSISRLSEEFEASAAGVGKALSLLDAVGPAVAAEDPERILRAALASQERLASGKRRRRFQPRVSYYDPEALRLDVEVGRIEAAVDRWRAQGPEGRTGLRLLFAGPPGSGKTEFCRHLAARAGMRLVAKRASDLLSMFVGGTERQIAAAFEEAEDEDAILLIDEADGFLRKRSLATHSWEMTEVTEFLTQMESFGGILACCTNLAESLDPASIRRFQLKVEFGFLDSEGILGLISRAVPAIVFPDNASARLAPLSGRVTAGDFSATLERLAFEGLEADFDTVARELARERDYGPKRPARKAGFDPGEE